MSLGVPENASAPFVWLQTVDEGFERMLAAIEAAKKSIRLEAYIFRTSPLAEQFREALIRACNRGVRVQVLIDALGSISLPEKFWDDLIKAGGAFRWFNPIKFKRLSFRNHRKVLVCDDEVAFVGGFNIAPEYQGDGVTKGWHDLGLQVSASLARELAKSSDMMFSIADFKHRRFTRLRRSAIKKITSTDDGQLLVNAPGRGLNYLQSALLTDLRKARKIHVISAYFLPPRQMRRELVRTARTGGKVKLILAGKSDVTLSLMASRHLYRSLLQAGVEIYEYQPQILHTKLFIFNQIAYVGSANLDKRSLYINYELLIRLDRPKVVREADEMFQNTLAHCQRIEMATWGASRNMWTKLREQWAYFVLSKLDPYLTQLQLRLWERGVLARAEGSKNARTKGGG